MNRGETITATTASPTTNNANQPPFQDHIVSPTRANEISEKTITARPRPAPFASSVGETSGTPLPSRLGTSEKTGMAIMPGSKSSNAVKSRWMARIKTAYIASRGAPRNTARPAALRGTRGPD